MVSDAHLEHIKLDIWQTVATIIGYKIKAVAFSPALRRMRGSQAGLPSRI